MLKAVFVLIVTVGNEYDPYHCVCFMMSMASFFFSADEMVF